MARFIFQLQAVLDQRENEEGVKQRAVAVLERERMRLEQSIRDARDRLAHETEELRALLGAGGAPVRLDSARAQASAGLRLHGEAQRHVLTLAGVHRRLEAARAELLEASKRRKAVQLLRDRRYEEWRIAQNRRENAEIDELAVMRHARTGPQGDAP